MGNNGHKIKGEFNMAKVIKILSGFYFVFIVLFAIVNISVSSPLIARAEDIEVYQNSEGTYLISTAEELLWFSKQVKNGNSSISGELTADIDMSSICSEGADNWIPIGQKNHPFTGSFDGCGHSVENIYINISGTYYQGLFGYIGSDGSIKNIGVSGSINGYDYAGGVCGYNIGEITNCYSMAALEGNSYVGGICGYNGGTILNCYNTGSVSSPSIVGGICGYNNCTIKNSYNIGSVSGNYSLGGICGTNYLTGTIENCFYLNSCGAGGNGESIASDKFFTLADSLGEAYADDPNLERPILISNHELCAYKEDCAEKCYICGAERETSVAHSRDNCEDTACKICGEAIEKGTHIDEDKNCICDNCGIALEHDYQNEKCTVCGAFENGIGRLTGYTLSLEGNIAVNFHMELDSRTIENPDAYMSFTLPDGGTAQIKVSDAAKKTMEDETYYVFTCKVAAKEMTSEIKAQMFSGENAGDVYTYSVKEYADYILNNSESYSKETIELVEAMLNYGAYSQIYFDFNVNNPANENIADTDVKAVASEDLAKFANTDVQSNELAALSGANLSLESETTLRLYFNVYKDNLIFTCNGERLEQIADGEYTYVNITGITANMLDDDVKVTVSDGTISYDITYNVMSYCYNVLSRDTTETRTDALKDVIRALWVYNQKANMYFDE